jgi:hypothetical protein
LSARRSKMPLGKKVIQLQIAQPTDERLRAPALVLQYALDSVNHLLTIYNLFQRVRKGGAPRTEEQDLLRAIVVMACAGLDACVKLLLKNALKDAVAKNNDAREALRKFVERRLNRGGERGAVLATDVLAELLVSPEPWERASRFLLDEFTGRSLQSLEQLRQAAAYLGLSDITFPDADLKELFKVRNEIVHEMDMDIAHPSRRRRPRKRADMVKYAEVAVRVANELVKRCDAMLAGG